MAKYLDPEWLCILAGLVIAVGIMCAQCSAQLLSNPYQLPAQPMGGG